MKRFCNTLGDLRYDVFTSLSRREEAGVGERVQDEYNIVVTHLPPPGPTLIPESSISVVLSSLYN